VASCALILLDLDTCAAGYTPTNGQHSLLLAPSPSPPVSHLSSHSSFILL